MHRWIGRHAGTRIWVLLLLVLGAAVADAASERRDVRAQVVAPGQVSPGLPGQISVSAGGPYSGTVGAPVVFSATVRSPLPPGTPFQFQWSFGDGGSGSGQTTSHAYSSPGSYVVTVTVFGGGQTASASAGASIAGSSVPLTVSAGGPYTGQTGQPVQFTSFITGLPPGATPQYQWSFGDGVTGTGANPVHVYRSGGTYQVTLQVYAGNQRGFGTTTATITSANLPLIVSAGGPYTGVTGQPVVMTAQASGAPPGAVVQYRWSFGDGTSGFGQTTSHAYAAGGTYGVTLQVTASNGQSGTASTTVTIGRPVTPLQVSISGPNTGTAGQAVGFSAQVSGVPFGAVVSYQWRFGDGGSGTGPNVTHTYTAAGAYSISLQVTTSGGQSGYASASIKIAGTNPQFVVSAGGPYQGTAGSTVSFTGYVSGAQIPQFQWNFGDGGVAAGPSVTHIYQTGGTYTVTLTVTDLATGQSAGAATSASIGPAPVPPTPAAPPARLFDSLAYHAPSGRVVLFGGLTCAQGTCSDLNDTWTWDGNTWTQQAPAASPPTRFAATLAFHEPSGLLVLFGGVDCEGDVCVDRTDTWTWDGATWTQQNPASNPPERSDATMVYDAQRGAIVLFGGKDTGGDILGDTWLWDGSSWIQQSPGNAPPARFGAGMAYDVQRGLSVLFGGRGTDSNDLNDTWTWDGGTWAQLGPPTSPSPRTYTSMTYDRARNVTLLFGGAVNGAGELGDTWTWTGSAWTQQNPPTSPSPRSGADMTFNPSRDTVVLFGGTYGESDTWTWNGSTWTGR